MRTGTPTAFTRVARVSGRSSPRARPPRSSTSAPSCGRPTSTQYNSNPAFYRPPQLFAHSDQVTQWQTSIPDQPPTSGWCGRVADIINGVANPAGNILHVISLAGANTLQVGNMVAQYQVATNGAGDPHGFPDVGEQRRVKAMGTSSDCECQPAAPGLRRGCSTGHHRPPAIFSIPPSPPTATPRTRPPVMVRNPAQDAAAPWRWNTVLTASTPTSGPAQRPRRVSEHVDRYADEVIARSSPRPADWIQHEPPDFFCQIGGFDTPQPRSVQHRHGQTSSPHGAHYILLQQVNDAIFAFQRAMKQLGRSNDVTTFTASDFLAHLPEQTAREATTVGARIISWWRCRRWRKILRQTAHPLHHGPDDTGTGRWIPTLAVDQHAATLARWFGVDPSMMSTLLPNLSRFLFLESRLHGMT